MHFRSTNITTTASTTTTAYTTPATPPPTTPDITVTTTANTTTATITTSTANTNTNTTANTTTTTAANNTTTILSIPPSARQYHYYDCQLDPQAGLEKNSGRLSNNCGLNSAKPQISGRRPLSKKPAGRRLKIRPKKIFK